MAAMQVPRQYHATALLLPDGRVVVAGSGDSYGGPNQTAAEFYSPPYLFKGTRPTISSVAGTLPYSTVFTIGLTDTVPVNAVTLMRPGAVTHQFDEEQRYVSLTFQQNGNSLSVDAPASAALAPPGYYMLFVLNAAGVPSIARWVRLTSPLPAGDTTLPTSPENLAAVSEVQRVILSWNASSDNVGVSHYNVYRSSVPGFTPLAVNLITLQTATAYTDVGLAPGSYYYRVAAEDAAGNVSSPSTEATGIALPDTLSPTVSLTAPLSGAVVSGTVTITAAAVDDQGVGGVQFRVGGVSLGAEDTSAPYSRAWDTKTVPNGMHALTAVARDSANNQTTSSAVTVTVSNTAAPPVTGLVAAYAFNEASGTTISDRSGNSNLGTLAGATWTTAGQAGSALSFDGVNDRVNINDAVALDLTGGMTLEAWVYPTALSGWRTVLMKEGPGGFVYVLYAHDNAPRPAAYIRVGGVDVDVVGVGPLPLNTWTYLATTYDGATLRLYVNGAFVGSQTAGGSIQVSTGRLRIGGNAVWGEWFAGRIDGVRVYNRALSSDEIQIDMATPVP